MAEVANLINETKRLGLFGKKQHRIGLRIQTLQHFCGNIGSSLDYLLTELYIASQTLNRLCESVERLTLIKSPIVAMQEKPRKTTGGSLVSCKKNWNCSASNVTDRMHSNRDWQLTNEIVKCN